MRKYEIMYIVKASLEDAARQEVVENTNAILTNNGATINSIDDWGVKDFAYEIDDMTKGYYYVLNITAGNEAINEFDRLTRINKDVVRHMIIKLED